MGGDGVIHLSTIIANLEVPVGYLVVTLGLGALLRPKRRPLLRRPVQHIAGGCHVPEIPDEDWDRLDQLLREAHAARLADEAWERTAKVCRDDAGDFDWTDPDAPTTDVPQHLYDGLPGDQTPPTERESQ
jgi:hypothetical protein